MNEWMNASYEIEYDVKLDVIYILTFTSNLITVNYENKYHFKRVIMFNHLVALQRFSEGNLLLKRF